MIRKTISILIAFVLIINSIPLTAWACIARPAWHSGSQGKIDQDIAEEPDTQSPSGERNQTAQFEPVYLHNGDFAYEKQDLFIPARGINIEITRYYNSQSLYNSPFGYGWDMNYNQRIVALSNGDLIYLNGQNRRYRFKSLNGTDYISPNQLYDKLTQNADGTYTLSKKDNSKLNFDQNGCLVEVIDRSLNKLTLTYDSQGKLPLIGISPFSKDPNPKVISYGWRLVKITDSTGRQISLSYDTGGRLKAITDFIGRTITYEYEQNGDLTSVTYPATDKFPQGTTTRYTYLSHNLTSITDAKGQRYLENFYNNRDMVESQKYGKGIAFFTYDLPNRKTEARDALGFKVIYTFNDSGNPVRKEELTAGLRTGEPVSYITTYEYNNRSELTKVTYPKGNFTVSTYDNQGNLLATRQKPVPGSTEPDIVTSFTYEPKFNFIKTKKDANAKITTYYYDYEEKDLGDLNNDNITNESKGNLVKVEYPAVDNQTPKALFTYNSFGQLKTATNPNNTITKYEYYPDTGYLHKVIADFGEEDKLNLTTEYFYDTIGNISTVTDPKGNTTSFEYDSHNNLTKTALSTPFNDITKYTYDENDNLDRIDKQSDDKDHPWQTTSYTYTILDELNTTTDSLGNTTTFTYDANGNRTQTLDAEKNLNSYEYDERKLLYKATDAEGNTTEYSYDKNGNLIQIKDAKANIITHTYDDFDRLIKLTYPDNSTESYTYDANSNLKTKTDAKNNIITSYYDSLNRLDYKTYPDSSKIDYTYDLGSRLTDILDSSGTIHYDYDSLDRITKVIYHSNKTVSYEYDANSNRKKLTYPDQSFITYEYDQLNRLTYIRGQDSSTIAHYTYDSLSRRKQLDYANNTQTAYTYDLANRLTNLANRLTGQPANFSEFAYTYDKAGNRKTLTTASSITTYTYDKTYQLKTVDFPEGSIFKDITYNYDPVGNRTSTIEGTTTTTYTPNNLNQYTQVSTTNYTYDPNGNLVSDGLNTYTYDYENRLIRASVIASEPPSQQATEAIYTYDPLGRRTSSSLRRAGGDEAISNYLYDGDQILAEYDSSGNLLKKHIYGEGVDEILRTTDYGLSTNYYYHFDGLGSVTNLTDSTGAILESYTYDAYGKPSAASNLGNHFMFTGREYDAATGLYYYRARYYDPKTGRFLQRDPVDSVGKPASLSTNLYAYCDNDPINFVDPWGLCKDKPWWPKWSEVFIPGYGNYGGPFRTDLTFQTRPEDSMDRLFMRHDISWSQGRGREADRILLKELYGLPSDPKNWVEPPRSPWVAGSYRRFIAESYFWWRSLSLGDENGK